MGLPPLTSPSHLQPATLLHHAAFSLPSLLPRSSHTLPFLTSHLLSPSSSSTTPDPDLPSRIPPPRFLFILCGSGWGQIRQSGVARVAWLFLWRISGWSHGGASGYINGDRSFSFLSLFFVISSFSPVSESYVPCVEPFSPFVDVSTSTMSCSKGKMVRLVKLPLSSSTPSPSPGVELFQMYLVSVYPTHMDNPKVEVF